MQRIYLFLMFATLCGTAFASTPYSLVTFEKLPDCSASNLSAKEISALELNHVYVKKPVPPRSASMYSICKILTIASGQKIAIGATYDTDMSGNDSTSLDTTFNLSLSRPVQEGMESSKWVEFSGDISNGYLRSAFLLEPNGRTIGGLFVGNTHTNIGNKKVRSIYFRKISFGSGGQIAIGRKIFPKNPIANDPPTSSEATSEKDFECRAFRNAAEQIFHAEGARCKN